jgi:gliding motility-associated-like protein
MKKLLLICIGLQYFLGLSQTTTYNTNLNFVSNNQNLWGPGSGFNLNREQTLFDISVDDGASVGPGITEVDLIGDFGFEFDVDIELDLALIFEMSGWSAGEIDVRYPIEIETVVPTNNTYNQGERVTIETSYTVDNSTDKLDIDFPNGGEIALRFDFAIDLEAGLEFCIFDCFDEEFLDAQISENFDLMRLSVPDCSIELIDNNYTVDLCGGGAVLEAPYNSPSGWPFELETISIIDEIGMFGYVQPPFVQDPGPWNLNGQTLVNQDASDYLSIGVDVFPMLSYFLEKTGEPNAMAVGNLLGKLEDDFPVGPGTLSYVLFSAEFETTFWMVEKVTFDPTIKGRYNFPVAVNYRVETPSGSLIRSGNSSVINFEVGNVIEFFYPCYYTKLDIIPSYEIEGTTRNILKDSLSVTFDMEALTFNLNIPAIDFEGLEVWPEIDYDFGPIVEEEYELASFIFEYFDDEWEMGGFGPRKIADTLTLRARQFFATVTKNDVACYGDNTGSINVSLSNGSSPFDYNWSNGASTQDLSSLTAGNYQVNIFDDNGCQAYIGATIEQPDQPLTISLSKIDKLCNGGPGTGEIDLSPQGGTGAYTYAWTGPITANTQDLTGLNTGTYSIVVTDSNGCTANGSRTINEPPPLVQSAALSMINCNGGSDGEITATVGGGVLPYSLLWDTGENTESISSKPAGAYALTFTDGNGCMNTQSYTLMQPSALNVSMATQNVSCFNGNDGFIDLTVLNGTAPYTYQWLNTIGAVMPDVTQDLNVRPIGTYTANVRDANNCLVTVNYTITQPAADITHSPTLTNINCKGDATGVIDPLIAGGTSPYTYSWSNATSAADATSLLAGNYNLILTDDNGCSKSFNYNLIEPLDDLTSVLSKSDVLCFGDSTAWINSSTTGGTIPYTYSWSNSETTENILDIPVGTYTLDITDSKGCTTSETMTINEPPVLNATSVIVNVSCFGGSDASINQTITGGAGAYTFYWYNELNEVLSATSEDLTNIPRNNYTCVITDTNNCTYTLASIITQPSQPLAMTSTTDNVNCYGDAEGDIDITLSGGTTPYSYLWSNTSITEDLSNIVSNSYSVVVTDALNCTITGNWNITQPIAPLTSSITNTSVLCFGDNTGTASAFVEGGTLPYILNWSNGQSLSDIYSLSAGVYTLNVTDALGCTSFSGTTVLEPTELVITPTVTNASCYGYSDGIIDLNLTGGVQPYSLNWGNPNELILNSSSYTLENLSSNSYLIRLFDDNECQTELLVNVGQPTLFTSTFNQTPALCYGSNEGTINVTVIGGTSPYTYNWSNGSTTEDVTNLVSGNYIYTVTDDQNCIIGDTVTILQPTEIVSTYSVQPLSCIDQTDASIQLYVSGGLGNYTYLWSNGAVSDNIDSLSQGIYSVAVSDPNNCIHTTSITINETSILCVDPVNTITPNGDGVNEDWEIENLNLYPNHELNIFNRWGNILYTTNGVYTPWDGTFNGEALPSGVYYYIIRLNNGTENEYQGTITIIR